jgi:hypothetical protein
VTTNNQSTNHLISKPLISKFYSLHLSFFYSHHLISCLSEPRKGESDGRESGGGSSSPSSSSPSLSSLGAQNPALINPMVCRIPSDTYELLNSTQYLHNVVILSSHIVITFKFFGIIAISIIIGITILMIITTIIIDLMTVITITFNIIRMKIYPRSSRIYIIDNVIFIINACIMCSSLFSSTP